MKNAIRLSLLLAAVASGAPVDFTAWTEVDGSGVLTVYDSNVVGTNVGRNTECYVYQDFTVGYFEDFTARFQWNGGTCSHTNYSNYIGMFVLSNTVEDYSIQASEACVHVKWSRGPAGYYIALGHEPTATSTWNSEDEGLVSPGTVYFIEVSRDFDAGVNGTGRYTMTICTTNYYGESGASLVQSETVDSPAGEQAAFRYAFVMMSFNNGSSGLPASGTISSLDFGPFGSNPDPADEATLVALPVTLSWAESEGATDYNVYFGLAAGSLSLLGNVDVNEYEPFCRAGTEYQWRIDANNAEGATEGDAWTFTTDPNYTITLTGATGVTAVTPKFTFPAGTVDAYVASSFIKHLTSGVEDHISLSAGQSLEYRCSNWNQITQIDINSDKVSGSVAGWVLPAAMLTFNVRSTSVSGDISDYILPSELTTFYAYSTSVSGDISDWALPSSLAYFRIDSTSVSGDISDWALPSSLVGFYVNGTSLSGDVSGWVLPNSLAYFYIHSTSLSGDISGWVLPNSLAYFHIYSTQLGYGTGGMLSTWPAGLTKVDFDDCGLDYLEVNRALADCVLSGKSTKQLDIAGTNAGPSQTGEIDRAALAAKSWTLSIDATVNQKPLKSSGPWPTTGLQGIALDTVLTWGAAYDANDYNVYLNGLLLGNTSDLLFDPELSYATDYAWRIDPNYPIVGATTGDLWYFATEAAPVVEPNEPDPEEPEPESTVGWQKTGQWRTTPAWRKQTGLEGWRKR